jgi:hypothetical protein
MSPIDVSSFEDLYEAMPDLVARTPESLWLDCENLASDDVGALRALRQLLPACAIVLLVAPSMLPKDFVSGGVALGCHVLRLPVRVRDVAILCDRWRHRPATPPSRELIAGLADQLNNPLAALIARLQLSSIAHKTGQPADVEDNLGLALATAERLRGLLAKLELLTGKATVVARRLLGHELVKETVQRLDLRSVQVPDESAIAVFADPTLTADALGRVLAVCADLESDLAVSLRQSPHSCAITVRLPGPLPLPCPVLEILNPFRLNRVLKNPDLGLDLAVADALLQAQGGHLEALVEDALLAGFEILLPAG